MLSLGELHVKHAVQRGIWVPTQHLLWDQRKPKKTLIKLAGGRTFRMQVKVKVKVNGTNIIYKANTTQPTNET
jgi:hypothetical protein